MFKQYINSGKERLELLTKYRELAAKVKEIVRNDYKDARIYVFGSVLKGRFTASSDVDILIVCDNIDKDRRAELKVNILRTVGLYAPIELHIASTKEFKEWYMRFITEINEI
ncbi:MAG: nucleotidyltransferase domain-containing protein [Nitrososphaerales archaeon]